MYIPMTIGGKKYSETSLWTNASPTSDFAAQTVTLSEGMSNFKYLAIEYKANKTLTETARVVVSVEDMAKLVSGNYVLQMRIGGTNSNNTASYTRSFLKASDTSITFNTAYASNTQATANSMAIPLEILGLNELDTGKRFTETSLWTNSSPTSAFASQTVSLSESIENFDYIKIKFKYANGYDIFSTPIVLVSDFKTFQANSQRSGAGMGGIFDASNNMYARSYWYVNNTSVQFSAAYRLNSTTAYNDNLIPMEISGLKFA